MLTCPLTLSPLCFSFHLWNPSQVIYHNARKYEVLNACLKESAKFSHWHSKLNSSRQFKCKGMVMYCLVKGNCIIVTIIKTSLLGTIFQWHLIYIKIGEALLIGKLLHVDCFICFPKCHGGTQHALHINLEFLPRLFLGGVFFHY
jgi:hypothetical protein